MKLVERDDGILSSKPGYIIKKRRTRRKKVKRRREYAEKYRASAAKATWEFVEEGRVESISSRGFPPTFGRQIVSYL